MIVGLSIGGQDSVLVKQDKSSGLGPSELKQHLDELGDQLFTGACNFSAQHSKTKEKVLIFYTDRTLLIAISFIFCSFFFPMSDSNIIKMLFVLKTS